MIVNLDGLPDDPFIAAKTLLPELIAEDNQRVFVCHPAFVGSERPAQGGLQSEGREIIAGDQLDPCTFSLPLGAKADGRRRIANEVGKDVLKLAIVLKAWIGDVDRELDIFAFGGENDEFSGVFDGKRAPKHAIEKTEDSGVGADPETKSENCD